MEDGDQLYCAIDHNNHELAEVQVLCLCTFLSTDLPTTPFSSIVINGVCHLPPVDIADFIHLIDKVGCRNATIMSPYEFGKCTSGAAVSPCLLVKLLNLRHLELDTSHFINKEWSAILQCLYGSKLVSFSVCGLPFISLFRFMG